MPRVIPGVKPRVKDANAYYRSGRQQVLMPMFTAVRARLETADSVEGAITRLSFLRSLSPATAFVSGALEEIDVYHAGRFAQTFRSALSVDVRPFLTRPEIESQLSRASAESIRLIRTIPPRSHDALIDRMRREFREAPFDRAALRRLLRDEFRVSGFNLRRITRDQSSKLVGALTQVRQRQVGITRYRWRTATDERVREEHVQNNGRVFAWTAPPPTGHPGVAVLCRCVALPVVDEVPDAGI